MLKKLTFDYEILQLNNNRSTYFREEAIHKISQKHQIRLVFCEIQNKGQGYEFIVQGNKSRNLQVCYDRLLGNNKNWYLGFSIAVQNNIYLHLKTNKEQRIYTGSHIGFQQKDLFNIKNLNLHICIPFTYSINAPIKEATETQSSSARLNQSLWLYMCYNL